MCQLSTCWARGPTLGGGPRWILVPRVICMEGHEGSIGVRFTGLYVTRAQPHRKGKPMEEDPALAQLLAVLDTLNNIARLVHPRRLADLIARLGEQDVSLRAMIAMPGTAEPIHLAGTLALQACSGLRAAPDADNPILEAYRAMRQYSRALEAVAVLAELGAGGGALFAGTAVPRRPIRVAAAGRPAASRRRHLPFR